MALPNIGTFLTFEEFQEYKIDYKQVQLVSTETYNEHDLKKTVDQIGKEVLASIAIQLAIIGYGNKTYGEVEFNGVKIKIDDFFKKNGIKADQKENAKLKTTDLTPRRIIRFFRYTIDDFVKKNEDVQSYLFKKYCLNKDDEKRTYVYPGYEHVAQPSADEDKVRELLKVYRYLDARLETHIYDRIVRVLIARGFDESVLYINPLT